MGGLTGKLASHTRMVLAAAVVVSCLGEIRSGTLQGVSSWKFMDRFCFMPSQADSSGAGKGKFEYRVTYPKGAAVSLLLYYNEFNNWHTVYGSTMTCIERINAASTHRYLGDTTITNQNDTHVTVNQYFWFETRRARYFFVALANCRMECRGTKPNCQVSVIVLTLSF